MKNTTPKWADINKLANHIIEAEANLLKRRDIFCNILSSDTANEKDKNTASNVVDQIDDIATDNKIALKYIRAVVAKKTHLKPRAGIKESDQGVYLELITKIDTRLAATGAFDEMLLQKLNHVLTNAEI